MDRRNLITRGWLAPTLAIVAVLATSPAGAEQKLSRDTYEALNEARELNDDGKHEQALTKLEQLLAEVEDRKYAHAMTLQTLGYVHIDRDEEQAAIDVFEQALALEALPDTPRIKLKNMLARLYVRTDQYAKARESLDAWFAEVEEPDADDYALKANIHAQLDEHAAGLEAIEQAIAMSDRPREQYYQMQVSLQFAAERYTGAAETLQKMLANWPQKKRYWTQLTSVYLNLERNEDAHAVLQLAYRKGLLDSEDEFVRLARLGLSIGVPAEAGEVLEQALANGQVSATEQHWELLGQTWARAKEWDQAIAAYGKAADKGNAGKHHLRRARMFTYQNEWQNAIQAAGKALDDDAFDSRGEAHLLIGRGHLELDHHDEAMAAFDAARDYAETADEAKRWRKYAEREREYTGSSAS